MKKETIRFLFAFFIITILLFSQFSLSSAAKSDSSTKSKSTGLNRGGPWDWLNYNSRIGPPKYTKNDPITIKPEKTRYGTKYLVYDKNGKDTSYYYVPSKDGTKATIYRKGIVDREVGTMDKNGYSTAKLSPASTDFPHALTQGHTFINGELIPKKLGDNIKPVVQVKIPDSKEEIPVSSSTTPTEIPSSSLPEEEKGIPVKIIPKEGGGLKAVPIQKGETPDATWYPPTEKNTYGTLEKDGNPLGTTNEDSGEQKVTSYWPENIDKNVPPSDQSITSIPQPLSLSRALDGLIPLDIRPLLPSLSPLDIPLPSLAPKDLPHENTIVNKKSDLGKIDESQTKYIPGKNGEPSKKYYFDKDGNPLGELSFDKPNDFVKYPPVSPGEQKNPNSDAPLKKKDLGEIDESQTKYIPGKNGESNKKYFFDEKGNPVGYYDFKDGKYHKSERAPTPIENAFTPITPTGPYPGEEEEDTGL